jgi:hypothetical protein
MPHVRGLSTVMWFLQNMFLAYKKNINCSVYCGHESESGVPNLEMPIWVSNQSRMLLVDIWV